MDSVTHIAGPVVGYKGRCVQRCALCGEKLRDSLNEAVPGGPGITPPDFMHFKPGTMVAIFGNRTTDIGSFEEAEEIPDDFCITLVE